MNINQLNQSDDSFINKKGLSHLCGISSKNWGKNKYLFNKEIDSYIVQELKLECGNNKTEFFKTLIDKGLIKIAKNQYQIGKKLSLVVINYYEKNNIEKRESKQEYYKRTGYIYLIRNNYTKNLKIGYSKNPSERLRGLQEATDCELELLAFKKGTIEDEKKLHQKFNYYLIRNEWFKYAPSIISEFDILIKQ